MRSSILVLVLAGLVRYGSAACANDCSGNGRCNAHSACECYRNWMSNDCSQRVCFFGRAFVDTPAGDLNSDGKVGAMSEVMAMTGNTPSHELFDESYALGDLKVGNFNEAHFYAECSGKGTCERESGLCECFTGYEGEGCTRVSCPTSTGETCSGHGVCLRLHDVEKAQNPSPWTYNSWDTLKTQQCNCDPSYTGMSCDQRSCPSGDDPVTKYEHVTMLCGQWGLHSKVKTGEAGKEVAQIGEAGNDPSQQINQMIDGVAVYGTVSGASAKLSFFCGVKSQDVDPRKLSTRDQMSLEEDCKFRGSTKTYCEGISHCGWQAAVTQVTPAHGTEKCITIQGVNGLFTKSDHIVLGDSTYILNATTRIAHNYREELAQVNEVQTVSLKGAICQRDACTWAEGVCKPGINIALGFESAAIASCGAASTGSKAPFLTVDMGPAAGATCASAAGGQPPFAITTMAGCEASGATGCAGGEPCVWTPASSGGIVTLGGQALCEATKYNTGASCTTRNPFALTFKNEYGASFTTRTIECADYDAAGYHAHTFQGDIASVALLAERSATAEHCRGLIESALEDMPNSALADADVRDQHKGSFNDPKDDPLTDNLITWTHASTWDQGLVLAGHELDVHFVSNTGDVNLLTVVGQDTEVVAVEDNRIHHSNDYQTPDVRVSEKSKGTTDNFVCSNRGVCDYSTGTCKCFQGFTRQDCSLQNVLAMY